MGLLWYSISRNNALLSQANTLMIGGDFLGLNIPEGATLGALIQKAENTPEYLEKIKGLPTALGLRDVEAHVGGITGLLNLNWIEDLLFGKKD